MKKIWRNEEGVSPVIAVILMVAITVVLAAVLYVMVSGMLGGTSQSINVSMTWENDDVDTTNWTGNILRISGGENPKTADVTLIVTQGGLSDSATLSDLVGAATLDVGTITADFLDLAPLGKLGAEDTIFLDGVANGDHLRLTHKDAGEMHSYTFS